MIKTIKISKLYISFVFRHKWDRDNKGKYNHDFRKYEIGLWFRRSKMVGRADIGDPSTWTKHLVKNYMIGINLIICKVWISVDWGGKYFGL